MPTWIYHITHLKNLPSILQLGGLLANNRLRQAQIKFQDISHRNIQKRRAKRQVPCGPGGNLHDYVPFYFAPRSPMLSAIHNGRVPEYFEGQAPVLHLVTTIEAVEAQNLSFVFTDGHAEMSFSEFYTSLDDLDKVDWDIMKEQYWADTLKDNDRSRRRQAEFLVYDSLPWSLIYGIGVISEEIQGPTQEILRNMNQTTPVRIRSHWYY